MAFGKGADVAERDDDTGGDRGQGRGAEYDRDGVLIRQADDDE